MKALPFSIKQKQKLVERLISLIKRNNLSNRTAAKIIGLASHNIGGWINGISFPTGKRVLTLNEFFLSTDEQLDILVQDYQKRNRTHRKNPNKSSNNDANIRQVIILLNNILTENKIILQEVRALKNQDSESNLTSF